MAGSFASTDSSRTLQGTIHPAGCPSSTALLATLSHAPHEFLRPGSGALQDAALRLAKQYLDPLMARATAAKTGGTAQTGGLGEVYLEGFDVEQVWEQVKGVVEMGEMGPPPKPAGGKRVQFEDEEGSGSEGSSGSQSDEESEGESEGEEEDVEMGSGDEEEAEGEFEGFEDEEEEEGPTFGSEEEDIEQDGEEETMEGSDAEEKELVEDKFGLNDGFFSIDEFNRQTELLELQDQRGPLADDSDDDDIDLHADPAELLDESDDDGAGSDAGSDAALQKSLKQMQDGDDGQMIDDYDGGDASDSDGDIDMDGGAGEHGNTNDVMYADFFAPPARKKNKHEMRPGHIPKSMQSWRKAAVADRDDAAIESDMARVRRDLLDQSEEESDADDAADPADPLSRRSSHQKRQAALNEQIRALEAAAVAKRDWTLQGEANARTRPQNSLLEEDLDFERAGKPVPVITAEVTEGLEDMIKRRILAAQFDDLIRRRPDEALASVRRGRVEIDDAKPQASLAEIYEKEYQAARDPAAASAVDEKLAREHAEIASIWSDVSRKLDALSSWHYTPKPPAPTLTVVADAPAISIEEAQPGTSDAAAVSRLAPQELYQPGRDKAQMPTGAGAGREIVTKGGAPVSTREMTSDEKKRRRRREKLKIRKRNAGEGVVRGEVKEGSRKDVADTLRKGGVRFIGKAGEKRDVDGNVAVDGGKKKVEASFLKL
ncbi:putative U3 snoRNP protein [Geopyxis carbonaria]|nr:putative U3 snoRNP protein [Geopyxis carbonaria]